MSIVDDVRIHQNWGKDGYEFRVVDKEIKPFGEGLHENILPDGLKDWLANHGTIRPVEVVVSEDGHNYEIREHFESCISLLKSKLSGNRNGMYERHFSAEEMNGESMVVGPPDEGPQPTYWMPDPVNWIGMYISTPVNGTTLYDTKDQNFLASLRSDESWIDLGTTLLKPPETFIYNTLLTNYTAYTAIMTPVADTNHHEVSIFGFDDKNIGSDDENVVPGTPIDFNTPVTEEYLSNQVDAGKAKIVAEYETRYDPDGSLLATTRLDKRWKWLSTEVLYGTHTEHIPSPISGHTKYLEITTPKEYKHREVNVFGYVGYEYFRSFSFGGI